MNVKSLMRFAWTFLLFGFSVAVFAQQSPSSLDQSDNSQRNPQDQQTERARILMAEKRYAAAIDAYQDLLKNQPKNAPYLNSIGIAYLNMGNSPQAKKYFERSAKADKKYSSAVNNLGMIWYQQNNYRRAIREYQRAISIDPALAGVHVNLAFAYYNTKKYPLAFAEFHKALELDPHALERNDRGGSMMQDRTVANHGLFFFLMAREYAQQGDAEHCAAYLRKSLDEGYPEVAKAGSDPTFKKVVDDPGVQGVLLLAAPKNSKGTAPSSTS